MQGGGTRVSIDATTGTLWGGGGIAGTGGTEKKKVKKKRSKSCLVTGAAPGQKREVGWRNAIGDNHERGKGGTIRLDVVKP